MGLNIVPITEDTASVDMLGAALDEAINFPEEYGRVIIIRISKDESAIDYGLSHDMHPHTIIGMLEIVKANFLMGGYEEE